MQASSVAPTPTAVTAKRPRRLRRELLALMFVLPFLLVYAVFTLWPIASGLVLSMLNVSLLGGQSSFQGLDSYGQALHDPNFWAALSHSVQFTILTTPPLVLLGFALALLANRPIPGRAAFRLALFAPYVLTVTVVTTIWVWLYEPGYGLIDGYLKTLHLPAVNWLSSVGTALPAVAITTIWWSLGFNFLLYLVGLQSISPEIYEAANLDGAVGWSQLRYMTVPLLVRTTVLVVILQVLASLKVFGQIYAMTNGGPEFSTRPVVQYIYEQGFTSYHIGYAAAISYIYFVILLAVSAVQFKFFGGRRPD